MAGAKDFDFREKVTPYLWRLLERLETDFGPDSPEANAIRLQYVRSTQEAHVAESDRMRHYFASAHVHFEGSPLKGVERLYRRTILIQPTMACAAHCRWCLRGQYPISSLRDKDFVSFAKYCGSPEQRDDLREVLVTGGDPFLVPQRLLLIFAELKKHAPNIRIVRIGTRVPVQDPGRVNPELLAVLGSVSSFSVEIGTHVNHPIELTPEAREAYARLREAGCTIYAQMVLLKGVNDRFEALRDLLNELRYLGIETHYLFHCVPMRGMSHHRTSVERGLELIRRISSSGEVPGRAKPMYTLMTDLGKTTLYEGSILDSNNENELLIQTNYRASAIQRWNPSWKVPESAHEDENGTMRVWYPDGRDEEQGRISLVS